jgi:predicted DNA-binding ribbon-helix-helix protein
VIPPPKKSKSLLVRRSIYIEGRKSTAHVESLFWTSLKEIAETEKVKLGELISRIDRDRDTANLSSAIRLYVLDHYRRLAEAAADRSYG